MNQSRTKSTVTLLALLCIGLMFVLMIVSIIQIRQNYVYKQRIENQERIIDELNDKKDFYESQLNKDNSYNNDDLIFEVK